MGRVSFHLPSSISRLCLRGGVSANLYRPVLVNVASFRNIIGFAFSFGVTDWIEARGYLGCFGIYAGVIAFLSLGIPFLMIFGKRIRKSTGGRVKKAGHSD
jgi:hypothetical protein